MISRRKTVRIYNGGEDSASTVIGFSQNAYPDMGCLDEFFGERGYSRQWLSERPDGSVSAHHLKVQPPLCNEHVAELGALCALKGTKRAPVLVIDNRDIEPIVLPHGKGYIGGIIVAMTNLAAI